MKKDIAAAIKVSPSTLSRELSRNSGNRGHYNWETAQYNAMYHRHRSPGNRAISPEVKSTVLSLLTESQWSPEQISGRLSREGISVSHETIYRIYARTRGREDTSIYIAGISSNTGPVPLGRNEFLYRTGQV